MALVPDTSDGDGDMTMELEQGREVNQKEEVTDDGSSQLVKLDTVGRPIKCVSRGAPLAHYTHTPINLLFR